MTATFALGPTSWSWAKKKEKGKVKGKEAMLGVKEKKMREQELEEMENAGSYWDDGEEEEVSLYANRFIKIGTGAQEVSERSQLHN